MKYWEIMADKLSAASWSWGYRSAVTRDGWRWIVDAHREGQRCIVRADEKLTVFVELEPARFVRPRLIWKVGGACLDGLAGFL